MKILFTFLLRFASLKNLIRIAFLFLTSLLFRFLLIKYCNVDVFYNYISLYSNLYYLLMAMLSVYTLEAFQFISDWSYIFKCIKIFVEHYLESKMVLGGLSSGFY